MLWHIAAMCAMLGVALGWEEYSNRMRDDCSAPRSDLDIVKLLGYGWFAGIVASSTETWKGAALVFLCGVGACRISKLFTICLLPLFPTMNVPDIRARVVEVWTKWSTGIVAVLLITALGGIGLTMNQDRDPYGQMGLDGESTSEAEAAADAAMEAAEGAADVVAATEGKTNDAITSTDATADAPSWAEPKPSLSVSADLSPQSEAFDPEDFKARVAEINRLKAEEAAPSVAAVATSLEAARLAAERRAEISADAAMNAEVTEGSTDELVTNPIGAPK